MRNVVETLVACPESYTGKCEIVLSDIDFDIVARNAIFLLAALIFPSEMAVPLILHLWYSAMIPKEILQALQEKVLPLIEDVCIKIMYKPTGALFAKTWNYDSRSLRLVLAKEQWDYLLEYFEVPSGLTMDGALEIRRAITLAPERKDHLERALYLQPLHWRISRMKFRHDGILLPFGSSRSAFVTPNP